MNVNSNKFKQLLLSDFYSYVLLIGSELSTIWFPTASDLSIDYLSKAGSMVTGNENYQTNICDTRHYFNGNIKHIWNME